MLKKLSVATFVAAMSVASVPCSIVVAHAQSNANEPPVAPNPDDAKDAAGAKSDSSSMSKGSMSKGSMSKKSMSKGKMKHHMKKSKSM